MQFGRAGNVLVHGLGCKVQVVNRESKSCRADICDFRIASPRRLGWPADMTTAAASGDAL